MLYYISIQITLKLKMYNNDRINSYLIRQWYNHIVQISVYLHLWMEWSCKKQRTDSKSSDFKA